MSKWPGWVKAVIEATPTDRGTDSPAASIPPRLFTIWLILARFADNDTGEAWPSLATLSRRSGCDTSNMSKALTEGESLGLWTRRRTLGGNRYATTHYFVHRIPTSGKNATPSDSTSGKNAIQPVVKTPYRTKPVNSAITCEPKRSAKRPGSVGPNGRKPDPIWDAVVNTFRLDPKTKAERTRVGRLARDMKLKSATASEIRRRLDRYRAAWPEAADTPEALLKHWDRFATPVGELDADPVTPPDEVFLP